MYGWGKGGVRGMRHFPSAVTVPPVPIWLRTSEVHPPSIAAAIHSPSSAIATRLTVPAGSATVTGAPQALPVRLNTYSTSAPATRYEPSLLNATDRTAAGGLRSEVLVPAES